MTVASYNFQKEKLFFLLVHAHALTYHRKQVKGLQKKKKKNVKIILRGTRGQNKSSRSRRGSGLPAHSGLRALREVTLQTVGSAETHPATAARLADSSLTPPSVRRPPPPSAPPRPAVLPAKPRASSPPSPAGGDQGTGSHQGCTPLPRFRTGA